MSGESTDPGNLDTLVADDAPPPKRTSVPKDRPLGRYVVLRPLGEGGMGIVYLAYDPELDRKLAVKVMRPGARDDQSFGVSRLLREAQAMAKLNHPNVVAVYDVGTIGHEVFVAMEYLAGGTLRQWQEEKPRDWRAARTVFMAAGRGLAAAHAAELIHRDFKPENVLLDDAGRVRVGDFGLARATSQLLSVQDEELPEDEDDPSTGSRLDVRMTMTGAALGTPAYMAPEQHRGEEVGPAADQFAFCVALYEALYGERPFGGETMSALYFQIMQAKVRDAPSDSRVPAFLRRVLIRGLAAEPDARWPTMDGLLAELAKDPVARRRRVASGVLVAAAFVGIVGVALSRGGETDPADALCTGGAGALESSWDESRKQEVRSAFLRSGASWAQRAAARTEEILDEYAQDWIEGHRDACEATRVRGEQSVALMDQRMACLDRRRKQLDSVTTLLAKGDEAVLEEVDALLRAIGSLELCRDVVLLQSLEPLPEDPQARAALQAQLDLADELRRLTSVGQLELADERARGLDPESIDHERTRAHVLHALGTLRSAQSRVEEARPLLARAYADSVRSGDHRAAAEAARGLAMINGVEPQWALEWAAVSRATIARMGGDDQLLAGLEHAEGVIYRKADRAEEAIARFQAARELAVRHEGPAGPGVGDADYNLGTVYLGREELDEASRYLERATTAWRGHFGAGHPRTMSSLQALAVTDWRRGHYEDAAEKFQEILRVRAETEGEGSAALADVHFNLAGVLIQSGRTKEALVHNERARAFYVENFGSEHLYVAMTQANLAMIHRAEHRYDDALEAAAASLRIMEAERGLEHPDTATAYAMIGHIERDMGRLQDARFNISHSLEILEKGRGEGHPSTAEALTELARLELLDHRPKAAEALLERARATGGLEQKDAQIDVEFLEAWVEWELGDRKRGRAMVEGARRQLDALDEARPEVGERIDAWLEGHPA